MSASKEKKPQENSVLTQNTQAARNAKEANQDRKFYITVAITVIALAVAFVICFLYSNEGIRKNMTAVTVDGEKYSVVDLDYYYNTAINQAGSYLTYLGVDPNQDLDAQPYSEDQSWGDYFRTEAVASLTEVASMYHHAMDNGYEISDELQADIDAYSASIDEYCKNSAMTREQFLQHNYGDHMTDEIFMKNLTMTFVASDYAADYSKNHEYSDEELNTYYKENKNAVDLATYEVLTVNADYTGIEGVTEGSTEEEPTYTEEQTAQAMDAAKATAEDFLKRVKGGEALSDISKEYGENFYSLKEDASFASFESFTYNDWVFDESRTAGEAGTVVDDTNGCWYVVVLKDRYRPDYNTVDVRHILIPLADSGLQPGQEGYEEAQASNDAFAKNKAQELLDQYLAGDKTAEAFGELAKANSTDGSAAEGGLISRITKGAMVAPFEEWCFAEGRQPGDTGIVKTEYGYHVMYFEGTDVPCWQARSMDNLYTEWQDSILDGAEVKEHKLGIKAIG